MQDNGMIHKPLDEIKQKADLLGPIRHLLGQAEEHAKAFIEEENKNMAYFRGNHFVDVRSRGIPTQKRQLYKDLVEQTVSDVTPILKRARPTVKVDAKHAGSAAEYFVDESPLELGGYQDEDVAEIMTDIMVDIWDQRKESVLQGKLIKRALIAGVAWRVYSTMTVPNYGDVPYPKDVNRDQVLLDPDCTDLANFSDCKYVFLKSYLSANEIQKKWQLKETDYATDSSNKEHDSTDTGIVRKRWLSADGSPLTPNSERITTYESPVYEILELYWNPVIPDIISKDDTEAPQSYDKNMNPRGKRYVIVNRKIVVEDEIQPYWHGMFPVVAYVPDPLPGIGHGYSLVSKLISSQDFVNILFNLVAKNASLNGGTQYLYEKGALNRSDFRIKPNAAIPVAKDALRLGRIKEIPPGDVGASVYEAMERELQFGKESLGDVSSVIQGNQSSSIKSGKHASIALESANTRFSELAENLEAAHERAADMEVSLLQQFGDFDAPGYTIRNNVPAEMTLALRDLIYKIKLLSKANIPASRIGDYWQFQTSLLERGLISFEHYFRETGMYEVVDDAWREKITKASEAQIIGLPPAEQQIQQQQLMAQAQQLAGQLGGQTGIAPGEAEPAALPIAGGATTNQIA